MYRFTLLFTLTLLGLEIPAHAKSKPKPPPIEVCYGGLCVTDLRWPERLFGGGQFHPLFSPWYLEDRKQ